MNKSESIKNISTALSKFQGEVKNPPKSANNPFFKSKYTTLDVLVDTAKPLLQSNGLSYIQSCGGDGANVSLTTLLMHSSGEWIESDALVLKADKQTAQGAGSAITYARRYALAAMLGLASDEDDDGNDASGNKADKKSPAQVLSVPQIGRLYAIAKTAGYDKTKVDELINKKFGLKVEGLSKEQYETVVLGYEKLAKKENTNE